MQADKLDKKTDILKPEKGHKANKLPIYFKTSHTPMKDFKQILHLTPAAATRCSHCVAASAVECTICINKTSLL